MTVGKVAGEAVGLCVDELVIEGGSGGVDVNIMITWCELKCVVYQT